jgi:hypothetical protein
MKFRLGACNRGDQRIPDAPGFQPIQMLEVELSGPIPAISSQHPGTWIEEIVLPRRHRTTNRIVADAWSQERPLLAPVANRLLHPSVDLQTPPYPSSVIDLTAHRLGEHVQVRDLAEYEVAL